MSRCAVILVESEFQDEEVIYPYYRLQEAGFNVDVASSTLNGVIGKHGIKVKPTCTFDDLERLLPTTDVVIVPGGWRNPELLRVNQLVLSFLGGAVTGGVVVGAICHGPWVLISAGVVRGRRMTCYRGMRDDLSNAGAVYVDEPVVADGNLVSSPHYRNNPDFMRELLKAVEASVK